MANMIDIVCDKCGITFKRREDRVSTAGEKRQFCSVACRGAAKRNKVEVACTHCGKQLFKCPSVLKLRPTPFCSARCYTLHQRTGAISGSGYPQFCIDNKRQCNHVAVMEAHIGRKLHKDEVVHHINEDRKDYRLENLRLMKRRDHIMLHKPLGWDIEAAKLLVGSGMSYMAAENRLGIGRNLIRRAFVRRGITTESLRLPTPSAVK